MVFWTRNKNQVVTIDQTGADIKIAHAKEVNARQIGGTINNYYGTDASVETTIDEQDEKPGRNLSVGVVNWSDFGL